MKLAATLFVAALSMVGCVGVESSGGGQGDGIYPAKADVSNPNDPKPFDTADVTKVELKGAVAPADAVCDGCVVQTYRVIDTSAGIDEMRVVSDGGTEICRIYFDNGQIVSNECGWVRP